MKPIIRRHVATNGSTDSSNPYKVKDIKAEPSKRRNSNKKFSLSSFNLLHPLLLLPLALFLIVHFGLLRLGQQESSPKSPKNNIRALKKAAEVAAPQQRTLRHVFDNPNWKPGPNIPTNCVEGSCVWHGDELWCTGSVDYADVVAYSPKTKEWTFKTPLPAPTHHIFDAAKSLNDGKTIALIGGSGHANGKHYKVKVQMIDTDEEEPQWRDGAEETGAQDLDLGGVISCTQHLVQGEYYCLKMTDPHFIPGDTCRFFAFNPETVKFRELDPPKVAMNHVPMIADPVRNRVIYYAGRLVSLDKAVDIGPPSRWTYFYDVSQQKWDVEPPQKIPEFMPGLEGRGFYQDKSSLWGYLMGGQNTAILSVSDIIYKFSLSPDPADRQIHIERWGRLPESILGRVIVDTPDSDDLMIIGGSNAVGNFGTNKVWFWNQQKDDSLPAYELERKIPGDPRPEPKLNILTATFGYREVTQAVQTLVDDGFTHFYCWNFPDLGLLDDWQWNNARRFVKKVMQKQSNGKLYRVGVQKENLMITIEEPDGNTRVVVCPIGSGCRLSWWNEAEDEKKYLALNRFPNWGKDTRTDTLI